RSTQQSRALPGRPPSPTLPRKGGESRSAPPPQRAILLQAAIGAGRSRKTRSSPPLARSGLKLFAPSTSTRSSVSFSAVPLGESANRPPSPSREQEMPSPAGVQIAALAKGSLRALSRKARPS